MKILFIVNNPVHYTQVRDYFENMGDTLEIVHNYMSAQGRYYDQVLYEKFTSGAGPQEILKKFPQAVCIDEVGSIRAYLQSVRTQEEPQEVEEEPSKDSKKKTPREVQDNLLQAKIAKMDSYHKPYFRGNSKEYITLYSQIKAFSPILDNFLLIGESGTGKEHTAYDIHEASGVSGEFVSVDCGVFNDELIASELFGHKKGSFTGAIENKTGYFEIANEGTLFLDEVENLSYKGQITLLRVLQERVYHKVGGTMDFPVTCKIICSTNVDLLNLVEKKRFRLDLYYRINQITLKVPSLKEVPKDIPELIDFLIAEISKEYNIKFYDVAKIKKQAVKELYPYPGNIRQLKQWLITKAFEHLDPNSNIHGIELMRLSRL
jgi:transcriptional regulator with PAS, ATPase and Fis domain